MLKFSRLAAATLVLALGSVQSLAVPISASTNNPYSFSWAYNTGSSTLTGNGTMVLGGFNSNVLSVTVSLSNTSAIGGIGGERLTAFGFGIDPNATGVGFLDVPDSGLINASMSSIPGLATIEICAYGGSNCQGGSNGGIYAGTSDAFTLLLAGNWGSSVNIDPIGFKYQTGYGSFEFTTTNRTVPEPATLGLLGLGLAGLGAARRRRNA